VMSGFAADSADAEERDMEDGLARASDEGVPQGGNLSPLLSNVYLHYALDLWFERRTSGPAGEMLTTFAMRTTS